MVRLLDILLVGTTLGSAIGCAGGGDDADSSADAITARDDKVKDFVCTAVASSASDPRLRSTRLDITADETPSGVPTGMLLTAFEASLGAQIAFPFGVSRVRDTSANGHAVSEYTIAFGADAVLRGSSGGTLTVPTAFTRLALESSAALNVATLKLTPSNATVTYKCKKDRRKTDPGPAPDPLVFQGAAKAVVAKDSCAKDVAAAVMDALVAVIEEHGADVPDSFVFTKIDRTDTGFKTVVNGVIVPAVVGAGCSIKSVDTSGAGPIGG